jgi:zinc transporter 14
MALLLWLVLGLLPLALGSSGVEPPLAPLVTTNSSLAPLPKVKPSSAEVWGYGLLMVTLISLTSIIGVGVLPLMSRSFYSRLLTGLIGLAVGSLVGSAVFHLIPAAFRLNELAMYPHHSYLYISMSIWLGMYLFFVIERFLKMFMDAKARREGEEMPGHGHSHAAVPAAGQAGLEKQLIGPEESVTSLASTEEQQEPEEGCLGQDPGRLYTDSRSAIRASFGHQDKPHPNTRPTVEKVQALEARRGASKIATVAWMIIFGDGIHNFIDGLSIGAAFSDSILTGISVSVAVLCEEFPHELGDFAVLLNAGMTMKQAVMYNFLSACTCYLGLVLGILLGELEGSSCYIFGLAGGMFLYISLVDMMPELNEAVETASKTSFKDALVVFALQNIGILTGVVCLFTLALYQDDILLGA